MADTKMTKTALNIPSVVGRLRKSQLLLPIAALILMLIVNVIITPDFFKISINNGVLYGFIIDVLNRSCELIILAIGMTLVVAASRGMMPMPPRWRLPSSSVYSAVLPAVPSTAFSLRSSTFSR